MSCMPSTAYSSPVHYKLRADLTCWVLGYNYKTVQQIAPRAHSARGRTEIQVQAVQLLITVLHLGKQCTRKKRKLHIPILIWRTISYKTLHLKSKGHNLEPEVNTEVVTFSKSKGFLVLPNSSFFISGLSPPLKSVRKMLFLFHSKLGLYKHLNELLNTIQGLTDNRQLLRAETSF